MRYSIKKQFAYIFIALMAGTILLCWFLNSTFLEKYYLRIKQTVLLEAYEKMNAAAQSGSIVSDEFEIELQRICGKYNITMIVIDADSRTITTSGYDPEIMLKQLLDNILVRNLGEEQYITETVTDYRTQTDYMQMWGMLDNGNYFLFRTAIEAIRDSVAIANRFLAYIGTMALLIGAVVIFYVSRKVTEPILKLAEISKRMTNLDFEVKYDGNSRNEIALLGHHMNQLSEALEKTISELKSANYELRKDNEEKTQIDEMRKEFISNVSHELKTPIALIQGYAEGLKEGVNDDTESMNFYCDVIMDESNKMNKMVKQLMSLSQLESGGDTITVERFNLMDLITNTVQSASILTRQNEIMVKLPDMGQSVYVWADEFKTEEVIRNYFSNAINHAAGDKIIEIRLNADEEKVRVSVFNTGEPVPEESLPYLWDKFYKVDKARTREYGGSGVGLSIVKAIMETMNQQYGVINYNNGVEFWMELNKK